MGNKFLSNKVTQKLSQQLLDTLSVCGGAFPLWCQHVAHAYSFLVPFEIRRQYFSCTSLGLARALHTLQRNAPPAVDSEISRGFKIGRIQRQKVRIFRSRILASALRVFQLYGNVVGRAILDERMLDIHLAIPLFKWMLGSKLTVEDLGIIYPQIAQTLQSFRQLSASYHAALGKGMSMEEAKATTLFNNTPLESLSLYFVLPTDSEWELKEGGVDELVTLDNVEEY